MRSPTVKLWTLLAITFVVSRSAFGQQALGNGRFRVRLEGDGAVELWGGGSGGQRFEPVFCVLIAERDPHVALRPAGIKGISYVVPTWLRGVEDPGDDRLGKANTKVQAGDGFDGRVLEGEREGRTPDLFRAAPAMMVRATGATVADGQIRWTFADDRRFDISAAIWLPPGGELPVLEMRLVPKRPGWYSVGYAGAQTLEAAELDELWQPLVWTEKRFPDRSYLTPASHGPLPAVLVSRGGATMGLIADPAELPFEPLPRFDNSRFGMVLRNPGGKAQPMVFAPILGGAGSRMEPEQTYRFRMRLVAQGGSITDAFEGLARGLYGFGDRRRNTLCSLNTTLENMIDYGLSPYSRFNEDLRGCAYDTDAPGTVKNVSALHPLAVALVTDNEEIYRRRARPIVEFELSRQKLLFATSPEIQVQSPGWRLKGPCAGATELSSLYILSQKRTPLFLKLAEGASRKPSWQAELAMYRATGKGEYLQRARAGADDYIAWRIARKASDWEAGAFFWTSFAPDWVDLIELADETGERKYLDAAHEGARRFAQYIWMCPSVPEGQVMVNPGGQAPEYWYLKKRGKRPIAVPEERVPAWRVSEIGLSCESSGTSAGHRAVLLANHAPWMLRLAREFSDPFLHDIARWAVVGRYANFPGYHINTERTTVYEKPEYPLRPFEELTYNSFHFNHVWPHIAMLVDYLVADAAFRSGGRIDFPSRYAEGYAYIRSRVYGDRPGRFYEEEGVWLWMPKGLLTIDNVQLNYIAGRSEKGLFIALMNQSPEAVEATVKINPELARCPGETRARAWCGNEPAEAIDVKDGVLRVRVGANGITALAIDGAQCRARFQGKMLGGAAEALSERSAVTLDHAGGVHGMLLSFGPDLTSAYIYLEATDREVKSATLRYRTRGDWRALCDEKYPYEFTVELNRDDPGIEFAVESEDVRGQRSRSQVAGLER